MSFSEQQTLSLAQKIGCGLYIAFFFIASAFLLLLNFFSQCGAWATGECIEPSMLLRLAFFPGGPVILAAVGYALLKFFMRDRT